MSEVGHTIIIALACVVGAMCAGAAVKTRQRWSWRIGFSGLALLNFYNAIRGVTVLIAQAQ